MEQERKHDTKDAVVMIENVGTYAPNSSGGTGYTEYVDVCVTYGSGRKLDFRLAYWYETLNSVFMQLYDDLPVLSNVRECHNLLSVCLAGMVTESDFDDLPEEYRKAKVGKKGIELPEELKGKKFRIRKLTPKECFRLMGVDDKDIDKIQAAGISNSGQYKLAGNSIVVDVLFHIFRKMFIETEPDVERGKVQQMTLF